MKLTPQEKRKHLRGAPSHIVEMVEEKLVLWANGQERRHRGAKRPDETVAIAIAVEIEAARNRSLPAEPDHTMVAAKSRRQRQLQAPASLEAAPARMLLD